MGWTRRCQADESGGQTRISLVLNTSKTVAGGDGDGTRMKLDGQMAIEIGWTR